MLVWVYLAVKIPHFTSLRRRSSISGFGGINLSVLQLQIWSEFQSQKPRMFLKTNSKDSTDVKNSSLVPPVQTSIFQN